MTRSIKLILARDGPAESHERPENPANTRVLLGVLRVLGWVAVGVGWVYCFLSRREGDSEELVTAGGQNPRNQDRNPVTFGRLGVVGLVFLPMRILEHGFASGSETG